MNAVGICVGVAVIWYVIGIFGTLVKVGGNETGAPGWGCSVLVSGLLGPLVFFMPDVHSGF